MGWRLTFFSTLLLAVCTGCPHAWGRRGTIEQAAAQDIDEMLHEEDCPLDVKTWKKLCSMPGNWESSQCPRECRIIYP
ncbi:hypothetical protein F0U60_46630 [Archangium minus]|uniref:Lipoprotein n=1 Tax=Archangium minus TaxID=83450 RepID=A0ABY9X5V1_9BACT|nr:hypothetical protein F0U60_46630 [Archangium minus]